MFAKLKIGSIVIDALIDSGSSRSFIVESLSDSLMKETSRKLIDCKARKMVVANGAISAISGRIMLPVELDGVGHEFPFRVVKDLSPDCILGWDFMQKFGIIQDGFHNVWYINKGLEGECIVHGGNGNTRTMTVSDIDQQEDCCGLIELSEAETVRLKELLREVIPSNAPEIGRTSRVEHRIDVQGHTPIKQKYYRVSPVVLNAMYEEVDKLLAAGIIRPSNSEWSSPVVMVKRVNGKYRMCIDYRKVNAVSKGDAYPLPFMENILDELRSAKYITTIDLNLAYHQVPVEENSRTITTFTVPGRGLFEFTRMPFGLTGAPATFQRLIDTIITPEMRPHCFAYLDDIIIVSKTFEEHLVWLRKVIKRIYEAGLTISEDKSIFCQSEVRYLGFKVNEFGLQPDQEKVAPVLEFPPPKNLKQLRRFLGMTSWYRRFIQDYASLAEPLNRLLRKNSPWVWSDEQTKSFEALKRALTAYPILSCPDFSLPFVLQTDASTCGLGAVLTQVINGEERVIAFASRTLSGPERKYSTTELECLAIVWSIGKFRHYLEGFHFKVITDHSSLRWLHNLHNPTGRLARWCLELLEYSFEVEHRKGALHKVPDALSRMFEGEGEEPEEVCAVDIVQDTWYIKRVKDVLNYPQKFHGWKVVDGKLYYFKPNPLIDPILEDQDAWKIVVPLEK